MEIDDELKQSIARLAEESDVPVQMRALDAAIAGIPLIGGSISALLTTEGKRRLVERILELADAISKRVTEVEAATLDKEYFKSEEFQTLFALAWEQLRTTHDKRKMKQLASALVTSGTTDFKDDERKELFLRVLRDLSPGHIFILSSLLPSERQSSSCREPQCGLYCPCSYDTPLRTQKTKFAPIHNEVGGNRRIFRFFESTPTKAFASL